MSRSQGAWGGLGNMICIRGWKVSDIRLHSPPLLNSLVSKTPLKRFLTSQDLQELLGPQELSKVCIRRFLLWGLHNAWASKRCLPMTRDFLPKPQSWDPMVANKLQVSDGHSEPWLVLVATQESLLWPWVVGTLGWQQTLLQIAKRRIPGIKIKIWLWFLHYLKSFVSTVLPYFDVKFRSSSLHIRSCIKQGHLNVPSTACCGSGGPCAWPCVLGQEEGFILSFSSLWGSILTPDKTAMSFIRRNGRLLGVCASVDNCRLFVGGIPKTKKREEILAEMKKVTDGVVDVIVYPSAADKTKNRGFAFVEYESHRAAAMARRKLLPG